MSSHEHYAGEFGFKRRPKKIIEKSAQSKAVKDVAYHVKHSQKHATMAKNAALAHASATSDSAKAELKLIAAHAAKKAHKHAAELAKLAPGSSEAMVAQTNAHGATAYLKGMSTPSPAKQPVFPSQQWSPTKSQTSTGPAAQITQTPKSTVKNSKEYHAHHAEKHAKIAKAALQTHMSPLSLPSDKAKAALIIASALKKTKKHAEEATKLGLGSNEATMASFHHMEVSNIYAKVSGKTSPAPPKTEPTYPHKSTATSTSPHTHETVSSSVIGGGRELSVEEFLEHRKSFAKVLTADQKQSALLYSESHGASAMNTALRKKLNAGEYQKNIDSLDAMFAKDEVKMKESVILFRGTSGDKTYEHYAKMNSGDAFVEHGYSSTSMKKANSFGGQVNMVITVPKGGRAAPIPSHHPNELEYLIPRSQKFVVEKIEKHAGAYKKLTIHVTAVQE